MSKSDAGMLFSGAKWFMFVNIIQRVITFALNQSMISWTTPEVFGMAAISLELLLSTLLFLSREGIRMACIRETIVTADERQRVVNVSINNKLHRHILLASSPIVVLIVEYYFSTQ